MIGRFFVFKIINDKKVFLNIYHFESTKLIKLNIVEKKLLTTKLIFLGYIIQITSVVRNFLATTKHFFVNFNRTRLPVFTLLH